MKTKAKSPVIVKILLLIFAVYAAYTLVSLQLQIREKSEDLKGLTQQVQARKVDNAELHEAIEEGVSDDYIAQVARDRLGYVTPGERVFVDTSSK